jgi:hypothetical protein
VDAKLERLTDHAPDVVHPLPRHEELNSHPSGHRIDRGSRFGVPKEVPSAGQPSCSQTFH